MKLIHTKTKKEIKPGDKVETFRGEQAVLEGFIPPRFPGSTGRVNIKLPNGTSHSFYPGVINAEIVQSNFDENEGPVF